MAHVLGPDDILGFGHSNTVQCPAVNMASQSHTYCDSTTTYVQCTVQNNIQPNDYDNISLLLETLNTVPLRCKV